MKNDSEKKNDLLAEIEELKTQIEEANNTIQAIRTGQVDAIVIEGERGHQLYTLKSADHTYRIFIEKMKEGAVTLSKNGLILYCNTQFASMVKKPLSEVVGNDFLEFVAPGDKQRFVQMMEGAWTSDVKAEFNLATGDDRNHPFLLSFTALEFDEGLSLSIICTDLGKQKETEELLKKQNEELEKARRGVTIINEQLEEIVNARTKDLLVSREHFKFLADNIPVIVWTASPDGETDYFNNKWSGYTGLTLEESIGGGWTAAIHPQDREQVLCAWMESVKNEEPFFSENRLKNGSSGEYRWHVVYAVPFRDKNGELITWLGTSTDIQDRKQEMDKKDEFIGVASHELKTPLTSLKGYIQLMNQANEGLPPNIIAYLRKANDSVNKLQHLIDDLLDVSKIQSGKLEFVRNKVDLSVIVKDSVENGIHMFQQYEFVPDIEEGLSVDGNADRLEQVIMNLLSNAVKYSGGTRIISVSLKKEGSVARLSVSDRGIGLSEEDKKLVFDRFYRARTNKQTGGLGMGLYIASEIIKAHGGKMEVESKLNKGSVFSFVLPLKDC